METTPESVGIASRLESQESVPRISVQGLWKVFGKHPGRALQEEHLEKSRATIQDELDLVVALRDVNFEVARGETFVVMGLSGSGKSTLVRCLIRLVEPTSGLVNVDGEDVTQFDVKRLREFRRSTVAMVFQNFGLLPHKSVLDNAAYGLEVRGVAKNERYLVAREMLQKVGLAGWERANQRELSGGMQQRVGLARALAVDPSILLMDEPFSGLDPLIRRQMRDELSTLQDEIQKTIVFITHDLDEAITVGDRIAIMRDGQLIQVGSPTDIITKPADEFVKEFTQGIPRTRILNITSIVSQPAVICSSSDTVADLISRMERAKSGYAVGIGQDNQYLGFVDKDRLSRVRETATASISDLLDSSIDAVTSETTLERALPMFSDSDAPLAVVDETNTFVGVATQRDLLKMLADGT